MKDRGKAVEAFCFNNDDDPFSEYYYNDSSSGLPCRKHPSASPVGICAFCLKERLVKLVCSDCGEQRLSSCSCSDISSNRNSSAVEVGSVGRISFLIENEKTEPSPESSKTRAADVSSGEVLVLKRSSSSCVEIKRSKNGRWRIGRLFRKKRQKELAVDSDSKSEMWVVDGGGGAAASRCRSLNSFRGCGVFGSEDGDWTISGGRSSISGARASTVAMSMEPGRRSGFSEAEPRKSTFSESEPRKSTFSDAEPRKSTFSEAELRKSTFSDAEPRKSTFSDTEPRKSTFSDAEPRKSGCTGEEKSGEPTKRIFSLKETAFVGGESKGFIDLKFVSSSETKTDTFGSKTGTFANSKSAFGSMRSTETLIGGFADLRSGSVTDRGIKRSRRSFKGWKWVFGQNRYPSWSRSGSRKKKEGGSVL